jgi:predicted permease
MLTRRLPAEWRDFILGDLEEEFRARAGTSVPAARRWFWNQALRSLVSQPPRSNLHPPTGDPFMRTLVSDLRHALRVFVRAPSFALAVVAVLALGIGANTAIFSIVNAVLLRPLPFDDPARLVRLFHTPPQTSFPGMTRFSVSPGNFLDWKRDSRAFDGMAAYNARPLTLTGTGEPEMVVAGRMGEGFFEIARGRPALGRVFLPDEHTPGRNQVVILSDGFWKRHLGGVPDAVGRTLTLDGNSYTIVGVMPPRFSVKAWFASSLPVWVPLAWDDKERAIRENHNYNVVARLNPGVTLEQAKAELDVISTRLAQQFPAENAGWGATAIPLQELIVGDIRRSLVMLLAAVVLVLLIACANVGNLILARALARRKEIAIRSALGASRRRVFQHLIVEAMVLALAGGAAGLLLAKASIRLGASLLTDQLLPRVEEVTIDARVLLFALAASILTGILSGALPALRAGRTDPNDALKEGGRSDAAGAGGLTRRALIVFEVALSVVLLMGAGVMLRSLHALRGADGGFNPHNVLTMGISLPSGRYATPAQQTAFTEALLDRLRALPGVDSAAFTDTLPGTGGGSTQPMVIEGRAELSSREQPTVSVRDACPTYVRTMGIPVLRGRDFAYGDDHVLLVSAAAAKLLWGDVDPVGRRATLPLESRTTQLQVVGIVGDVKEMLSDDTVPTVYVYTRERQSGEMTLALRTSSDPMTLARPAVAAVRAIDPAQPVENVRSMDDLLEESLASQRFTTLLLEVFAAVALTLAAVGIYSVLSYMVRGRNREIGIRTALGAATSDVLRMMVVEGMRPALLGIAVGAAGALAAARLMTTMVYGVSASDPLTLVTVVVSLCGVALAASLLPAWRAARVNPSIALRG